MKIYAIDIKPVEIDMIYNTFKTSNDEMDYEKFVVNMMA
jgi:hypothetical protein